MNDYNTSNVVSVTDQYAALADLRREYCASGHAYQSFETWLCIQVKRLRAAHETGQSLQQQILVGIDAALKHPMRTPVAEILGNIRALLTQETPPSQCKYCDNGSAVTADGFHKVYKRCSEYPHENDSLRTPQGEPALTQTDGLPGTREPVVAVSKDNAGESPAQLPAKAAVCTCEEDDCPELALDDECCGKCRGALNGP